MARERKTNSAQSTLLSGITAGAATLTVASAADFPTAAQFRLIIGTGGSRELLLVTGVSGAVFTVDRGIEDTTGAIHSANDKVTLVETEAGQERFQRDWSNPLWGLGVPMQLLDASGAALTASSFSDVNMTNASKADVTGGSILMKHDAQGAANDYALIVKSAPTVPWTLTVGFIPNLLSEATNFPSAGVVVHQNSTGEFYNFFMISSGSQPGNVLRCHKFASPTSSATVFLDFDNWSAATVVWLKIEDNNTNLKFSYSTDGVHFLLLGEEARTTFLTPDEIGFAINNFGNGNSEAMATFVAWEEVEN